MYLLHIQELTTSNIDLEKTILNEMFHDLSRSLQAEVDIVL
jgi:hypothetical protein